MTNRTRLTGWRKMASALWDAPRDPQIYGWLELDATALLAFIRELRGRARVTPTHVVGRAVARALAAVPDLNVRLVGDHAVPRPSIDIFFITALIEGGRRDLSGVKIVDMDRKDVVTVADELAERSARKKRGEDREYSQAKRMLTRLPSPLLRVALKGVAWLVGERGVGIPWLGLEASPFGSAMVSSVGMLGVPTGFSPLVWLYRVPLMVLVGEISDKPLAVGGKVEVRPVLPVTFTADHRYADGAHLGHALQAFREYLERPAAFEPAALSRRDAAAEAVRAPEPRA